MKPKFRKGEIAKLLGERVQVLDNDHPSELYFVKYIKGGEVDTATESSLEKIRPNTYWRRIFNKAFFVGRLGIPSNVLPLYESNPTYKYIQKKGYKLGMKYSANHSQELEDKVYKRLLKHIEYFDHKQVLLAFECLKK